jgi:hypothetical protein
MLQCAIVPVAGVVYSELEAKGALSSYNDRAETGRWSVGAENDWTDDRQGPKQ